jgi:hypothetical protein
MFRNVDSGVWYTALTTVDVHGYWWLADAAYDLYMRVKNEPRTTTRACIKDQLHIAINGEFHGRQQWIRAVPHKTQ